MKELSPSILELREAALACRTTADLDLPVNSGFSPKPPQLSPDEFIRWCEEMMDVVPFNPDNSEQRFTLKGPLEFSC